LSLLLAVLLLLLAAPAHAGDTTLLSADAAGVSGNGSSFDASLSGNGRFTAFVSHATNLVASDANNADDIFLRDRKTGTTELVSVSTTGVAANLSSARPAISGNGRYIAFESFASTLSDVDGSPLDVFRHDRVTGETVLVSVDGGGGGANDDSGAPSISANGNLIAFESLATDLVADDTNGHYDVFVRDLKAGTTTRVSVSSAGAQATGGDSRNAFISANGRFVAFASEAVDLVTGDSNALKDIFVHDLKTGETTRVSLNSAGVQVLDGESFRPTLSANGRIVAFGSSSTQLVAGDTNGQTDVFVRDTKKGLTVRASVGPGGVETTDDSSNSPVLSASGKLVVYESGAPNLVEGDTNGSFDVFLTDWKKGKTVRLSVSPDGAETGGGEDPSPSKSGKLVAFESLAEDVVPGDANGFEDVFLRKK
jgi:Tol biopolymer transport system component